MLIDVTLLNDELDLLEFRFRYLSDFVDGFVVFEAEETFAGQSKPLLFTRSITVSTNREIPNHR